MSLILFTTLLFVKICRTVRGNAYFTYEKKNAATYNIKTSTESLEKLHEVNHHMTDALRRPSFIWWKKKGLFI